MSNMGNKNWYQESRQELKENYRKIVLYKMKANI